MSRAGHIGGFAARRSTLSPQALRGAWVAALDLAARIARQAAASGEGDAGPAAASPAQAGGDIARLMATLRDLKHDNFPVATWSAQQMAAAFLTLARSFVRTEMGPEARTACAGFLAAGAETLDGLLDVDRRAAAQRSWMRQSGERD